MAHRKMLAPKTRIDWATASAFVDPENPTVAELNALLNLSCAIGQDYTLNPTGSDTDDSGTLCDNSNSSTFTYPNYEASIPFFRDADIAENTSVFNVAFATFRAGRVEGYWVRRVGKLASQPYAAGDKISIFGVTTDDIQDPDDNATPKMFTVPAAPTGFIITHHEI